MNFDETYTAVDHRFRDEDPYARAKYDLTLRWLKPYLNRETMVYNIGCGAGYFNELAAQCSATVVACEPDETAYLRAVHRARSSATVFNLGLADFARNRERGDVVVVHDVLEHIEDDVKAVADLAHLVRPQGAVVVSVPALPSLFGLHDELLGHYRRYTGKQLRALVKPWFHVTRLQYFGMLSIPIVLWFSRWLRKPYPLHAGSAGMAKRTYALLCHLETYVREPIGTSIIALLRPRQQSVP